MSALEDRFTTHTNVHVANTRSGDMKAEAVLAVIFREDLHLEPVSPDTDLFTTGILDSLKIVEMIVSLETRLGLQIKQDDLEMDNFRSPASIAAFVRDALRNQVVDEAGMPVTRLDSRRSEEQL